MAVAGAAPSKTRRVAANDRPATRGIVAGQGTTTSGQTWDIAAAY